MFKFGNDYEKKSIIVLKKVLCVVLTLSLIVTVFTISATAGEYTYINKSKYHLANWYGLDELPYGNDTCVVYIRYHNGSKWVDLTFCFDKCTPISQYLGSLDDSVNYEKNSIIKDFNVSHLWGLTGAYWKDNGKEFQSFQLSVVSDSPVLYTYGNTGENWKQLPWTYVSTPVQRSTWNGDLQNGSVTPGTFPSYKTCYVTLFSELNSIGCRFSVGTTYWIYSNKLMVNALGKNYPKDNVQYYGMTFNIPKDSHYSGSTLKVDFRDDVTDYALACYPSSECLRDWQLMARENSWYTKFFDSLKRIEDNQQKTLTFQTDVKSKLDEMNDTLNQIMHPEDYPSGGLLNDKSYSDKLDGVLGDISSDTSAGNFINTLSASFMVIRGIWDKIVSTFGLYSVIGLLLFLAFTAYLFGRALKGRDS